MTSLAREVQNVQNPALGAVLIWRFCCAYEEVSVTRAPPTMPLAFIVLPTVLHQATAEFLRGTQARSGLRAFAAKFGEAKSSKQDLLLELHQRALRWREFTLQSLELATAGKLIHLSEDAEMIPLTRTAPRSLPDDARKLMKDAEKLGQWCGELTLHEIATTLKVRL